MLAHLVEREDLRHNHGVPTPSPQLPGPPLTKRDHLRGAAHEPRAVMGVNPKYVLHERAWVANPVLLPVQVQYN